MGTADEILKSFMKDCYKGDEKKVFIKVRSIRKDVRDIKIKEVDKSGNMQIRVHTDDEKAPPWYVHGFAIPLSNLGLTKASKKRKMVDILNYQDGITDPETQTTLRKIIKDYGEILVDGMFNKLNYKTRHFKKQKDYFKVKRKAL